jgi:conjugal transfer pilus assembly protein TraD
MQTEEVPLIGPEMLGFLPDLHFLTMLAGGRVVKGRLPILINDTRPVYEAAKPITET